jgi:TRAP-type C4-dicarboxylate transport system permease large subunit
MREPGFDDLANLWQDGEEVDREVFEALARRARWKGRLLAYADFALVLLLLGGLLPGIFLAPNATTIAAAILLLVATLWLSWTRRRLRQMASTLNTSDPAAFLQSSVANAKANLRRVNLSLMVIPPLLVMVAIFKGSKRSQGGIETLPQGILEWLGSPRTWVGLTIVFLMVLAMFRSRRRLRGELGRLENLRLDYERERQRDVGIE